MGDGVFAAKPPTILATEESGLEPSLVARQADQFGAGQNFPMLMPLQPEMPLYLHKVSDEGGGEVYSLKKRRMGACDIACATRGAGQSPN